jgi:hypothetical protein
MIEISSYDDVGGVKIGFALKHQYPFIGGASAINVDNCRSRHLKNEVVIL